MSQHFGSGDQREPSASQSGLKALRRTPGFPDSVEPVADHGHSNDHFALIYETQDELLATVVPFVRQGLRRGERCGYAVDERTDGKELVIEALRDSGVDVDDALQSGALQFPTVQETQLRADSFDPDANLARSVDTTTKAERVLSMAMNGHVKK